MQNTSAIALSGMNAANASLGTAAHNIANLQTPGFKRQVVSVQGVEGGGVQSRFTPASNAGNSLETDMVGQLAAKNSFLANLAVFKTNDRMAGATLSMFA
jgi:flagellar hook-associated protein FlgK